MKGGVALELLPGELEQIQRDTAEILQHHGTERRELIPIIQEIQEKLGYLPKPAMEQVARALDIPEVDVYSVAAFITSLLEPPGKHQIKVCMGTACHMMADILLWTLSAAGDQRGRNYSRPNSA